MSDKKSLRAFYKKQRHDMLPTERQEADLRIAQKLTELDEYKESDSVLVYVSSSIEVDTYSIIEHSLKLGKTVLAPRCVAGTNLMYFYEIKTFDDLEKGSFGIMEPNLKCEKTEQFPDSSCCIVPALSYDRMGYRLGFGKGFYDRFLCEYNGKKIGLCYQDCIADTLPADKFDIAVDIIVTDSEVINIQSEERIGQNER